MNILKEAGLPDGVINLIPGPGSKMGNALIDHPDLAGLNFTGSTGTFNAMWKRIGDNLQNGNYRVYPRLVGETGGKDFVLAHPDCDVEALAVALVRGSFEYQGQKCSAASRAYIPRSIWPDVLALMKSMTAEIRMGDVADFRNFMGAVIDKASYENIVGYIEHARSSSDAKIVIGGSYDDKDGWFVSPTVIEAFDPKYKSISEEIFGPVLTVHVYDDAAFDETLALVDGTSPYALTGAIFARDRAVILKATEALRNAAGNFYINDKPTGANVGQQPFGGGRMSGTNDKSATPFNLMRWINVRTIKENFVPPLDFRYPHMMLERTEPSKAKGEYETLYTGPAE